MRREEVLKLPGGGEPPVLLKDGMYGLLTVFPGNEDRCGVQVPGEVSHRWMTSADLEHIHGGALVEVGTPRTYPHAEELVQMVLAADWCRRGDRLAMRWLANAYDTTVVQGEKRA